VQPTQRYKNFTKSASTPPPPRHPKASPPFNPRKTSPPQATTSFSRGQESLISRQKKMKCGVQSEEVNVRKTNARKQIQPTKKNLYQFSDSRIIKYIFFRFNINFCSNGCNTPYRDAFDLRCHRLTASAFPAHCFAQELPAFFLPPLTVDFRPYRQLNG